MMDRKLWLETFIKLAVSGAPAIEYRKKLRIKVPQLGVHVKRLSAYMEELDALKAKEVENERLKKRQEAAAKARAGLAKRRANRPGSSSVPGRSNSSVGGSTAATSSPDPEAMGTREDSVED
jgi:hypothetical protein